MRKTERERPDPQAVLETWTERDLTAAAHAGRLAPAFEVEPLLQQLATLLEAGRHPVLAGEAGIGKTAAVHELVRRTCAGSGPPQLAGRRVLQFSLRQRAAALEKPQQLKPQVRQLVEALLGPAGTDVVPFFRDLHLAYGYDIEAQIQTLATRFQGPILAEGERGGLLLLFEYSPELAERFALVELREPPIDRAQQILEQWSGARPPEVSAVAREACEEALHLTHRFLPRQRLPRKALDLLGQVAALAGAGAKVDADAVIDRFCRLNHVPRFLVDPKLPLDLREVERHFADRVLGQAEAVQAVVRMVSLIKAGLSDARRPFGVFLFVGPTGVGKTHLAQLLAEYLFGSRERLVRINMADFAAEDDASVLFGKPAAYSLSERRGILTQRLMGQPFAVLLCDEFEKAHEKVHDRFLQLVDEGSFINGAGETVACRANILIATSNEGADVYRGRSLGFVEPGDLAALDHEVDRRLLLRFRFEFLNRFDQVVHFHPLTREDIRTIARRELGLLAERPGLLRRGATLEVDESVLDWLAVNGYDPHYGARVLRRTIERHVATSVAEALVSQPPTPGLRLELTVRRNRPSVRALTSGPQVARREPVHVAQGASLTQRRLDARTLRHEAEALLGRARTALETLLARQEERRALLEALNQEGAWESAGGQGYELLERYRELDVSLRGDERLAAPVLRLERELQQDSKGAGLARTFEDANQAFEEWELRSAEEGGPGAWLLISDHDPLRPAGAWVVQLAEMELQWARSLHLHASIVAYERQGDPPSLVALECAGHGALRLLAMERGLHRLAAGRHGSRRARVDVVPQIERPAATLPRCAPVRRRQGRFELTLAAQGRLALSSRGRTFDLVAAEASTLRRLLADLGAAWANEPVEAEVLARVYGEDGAGARDPRTDAVVPRLKDALKGRLQPLLEAWRRSPRD